MSRRVQVGQLHRKHRGVYAVGQPNLSTEGRWMAAVLACGEGAVLSHRDAAALWGLLRPRAGHVHVTVSGRAGRARHDGIVLHRSPSLLSSETTLRRGIPVTTPARTIADLKRTEEAREWRRAVREASVKGYDLGEVPSDRTRSDLERRMLNLCRRHRLPTPQVNATVGGYEVDFLWPERRLIAETDGWVYHRGRQAFEEDRTRDVVLDGLDHRVVRFTDTQLFEQPEYVVKTLRSRL